LTENTRNVNKNTAALLKAINEHYVEKMQKWLNLIYLTRTAQASNLKDDRSLGEPDNSRGIKRACENVRISKYQLKSVHVSRKGGSIN